MWDAYKESVGKRSQYAYLPFVFPAYFVTMGLILSPKLALFGRLLGPVWLPIFMVIPGIVIGLMLKKVIIRFIK